MMIMTCKECQIWILHNECIVELGIFSKNNYLDDEQDDGVLRIDLYGADMLEHATLGRRLVRTGRRSRRNHIYLL